MGFVNLSQRSASLAEENISCMSMMMNQSSYRIRPMRTRFKNMVCHLLARFSTRRNQLVEKHIGFMPRHLGMQDKITENDFSDGRFLSTWTVPLKFMYVHSSAMETPIVDDDYPWDVTFWI